MRRIILKKWTIHITFLVLALIAVFAAMARSFNLSQEKTFKIVYVRKHIFPDGKVENAGSKIRYGNTLGEWKDTLYNADEKEIYTQLHSREGMFRTLPGKNELIVMGSYSPAPAKFYDRAFHAQAAIRMEQILGYTAYVKGDGKTGELWAVPEFGSSSLKIVQFMAKFSDVVEAVEVKFEPAPADTFAKPNLPVSMEWLEKRLQIAEGSGNTPIIEATRKELEKWKSKP